MKNSLLKIVLSGVLGFSVTIPAIAQERYIDEVFPNVNVETGVTYGQGLYVFASNVEDFILSGLPRKAGLKADVYTPDGDTETSRPVVVVLHTGNFLPRYFNQSTTGSRQDSSVVTLCNRLAKRGFVAVAISYRLGWNPLSDQAEVRRATLLNAVYRGLHDVKTAVRFLKKTAAEDNNPYGIDPTKISLFGFGTGGYLSSNYSALDRIQELQIEKFVDGNGNLFVDVASVGNIDGSGGDTAINVHNWPSYNNDILVAVNAGGAVGDSSWIEAGESPMISFHCPDDPFAPFNYGIVIVPTTNENVVDVSGSKYISKRSNELGNNAVFAGPYNDSYTLAAHASLASNHPSLGLAPSSYYGLFPFRRPTVTPGREEASPWDFWVPAAVEQMIAGINTLVPPSSQLNATNILAGSLNNNPDMSPAKGNAYLDSIVGYLTPRLVSSWTVGIEENTDIVNNNLSVYPNPANDQLTVATRDNISITGVEIFNLSGALVASEFGASTFSRQINVAGLSTGLYLLRVTTDKGVVTRKLSKD